MDEHDNIRKVSAIGWTMILGGRVTSKPIQNPKAVTKISHGLSPPNLFITLSPLRLHPPKFNSSPLKNDGKESVLSGFLLGLGNFSGGELLLNLGGGSKPSNQNHTVAQNPWNTEVQGSNQATHRRLKGLIAPWHREFQVVKDGEISLQQISVNQLISLNLCSNMLEEVSFVFVLNHIFWYTWCLSKFCV